jgi:hypothetical protein
VTAALEQVPLAGLDRLASLTSGGRGKDSRYDDGLLSRHVREGDTRLTKLLFDPSVAGRRLWAFLLSEEERLRAARSRGFKIVGAMKDLGTVPVIACSLPNVTAFYPDGAWWTPCLMECSDGLLRAADALGIDESFCPVRAMLGAFEVGNRFPIPDLLVCSTGSTCDDFAAISQRLEHLGYPVLWWNIPARRSPDPGEPAVVLRNSDWVRTRTSQPMEYNRARAGCPVPSSQFDFVRDELSRVAQALGNLAGTTLTPDLFSRGVQAANRIRRVLARLRHLVFTAAACPLPALELLIAEMTAIHFCSDRDECLAVLEELAGEVERRCVSGEGFGGPDAVRAFWVNPVADLRVMNAVEAAGARLCGTEFMFTHALDEIPESADALSALAAMALADPMVGDSNARATRVVEEAGALGAEVVIVARVPGASHSAFEGAVISERVRRELGIPVAEIEVPPLSDSILPALRTRLEAVMETARNMR